MTVIWIKTLQPLEYVYKKINLTKNPVLTG